jgi:hypothetical protein
VASYEYSGTYYGSYYLFVTDTDTATGTESTGTVRFVVLGSDSASGSEAVTKIGVKPAAGETGTASEAGSIPSRINDTDACSWTEGTPDVGLTDTDFSNNYEVDIIVSADAGTGSETFVLEFLATDTCDGADVASLHMAGTDAALMFDQAQAFPVGLVSADSGSASEATGYLPAYPFSSSDSGSATEAGIALPDIQDTDAGTGADAQSLHVTLSDVDALTGTDSGGPLVPLSSADTGSGADLGVPAILSADSGSASEALIRMGVITSDSWTGTEQAGFPDNKFDVDTVTGTDAQSLHVTLSSTDSGQWQEISAHATPANLLYANPESFSIYRASILQGGVETAQLYAVREGQISPETQEYLCPGDDIVEMVWYNITTLQINVTGGFIPFSAIHTVLGRPVSSSGLAPNDYYAMAYGVDSMPPQAPYSMVLRTNGRDYVGNARTVDLVLYQVQTDEISWTQTYKEGMGCDYIMRATPSSTDEQGNALSVPQFGRIVDSPGVLYGPVNSVVGTYSDIYSDIYLADVVTVLFGA